MSTMHLHFLKWFLLCILANARRSIYCPLSTHEEDPQFEVFCTAANPCQDVDIYCPSTSSANSLLVDCNGPHACVNVNIYTSISSQVRCRGRSGACENVNYYCGDIQSVVLELPDASLFNAMISKSISCKFRHSGLYTTVNTFFGCYGENVLDCISKASTNYAYTDSRMYCGNDNAPCLMSCRTALSCMNNYIECARGDSNLCQCISNENCDSVEFIRNEHVIDLPTKDATPETTVFIELPPEAKHHIDYYVPMKSNDYLNNIILANDYCNAYYGKTTEKSFKVICEEAGENTGEIHHFSDSNCEKPIAINSETNKFPCILNQKVRKTQVARISRYIVSGVNQCVSEAAVKDVASEWSTYYLDMGNCAVYGNEENMWHQFTCHDGVLSHSLYRSSDCHNQSFIISESYNNGLCQVEIAVRSQIQTQYWQIDCDVRGNVIASTTTSKVPVSTSTTTQIPTSDNTIIMLTSTSVPITELTTTVPVSTVTATGEQTLPVTTEDIIISTSGSTKDVGTTATVEETSLLTTTTVNTKDTITTLTEEQISLVTTNDVTLTTKENEMTSSINIVTTGVTFSTIQNIANYKENDSGRVLKVWQLVLMIILPIIAIAIGSFIIFYAVQRWRKGHAETQHGRLYDEENQIYTVRKIQTGTEVNNIDTNINTETTIAVTTTTGTTITEENKGETKHTKNISQSVEGALISSETVALNTVIEDNGN